ncbi:MAG: hypothetical protein LBD12_06490 [Clostridiales Family XIII bacterium]|jgi:hypothetical protein|nr:hypothetical protein [Clostridiales Family XIII bacterium]
MGDYDNDLNRMLDERIEEMEGDSHEPVPGASRLTFVVALALSGILLVSIVCVYLSL